MRRRFVVPAAAALGLLLLAGTAQAWEARVLTLGDQNRFVEDDANIWLYPQRVVKYGDRAFLDLARKEGRVVDSEGEAEGLEAIKGLNGGFFLELSETFHMAFVAGDYTDETTYNYLTLATAAQQSPANCGSAGDASPNSCGWMSEQGGLNADGTYRGGLLGDFTMGGNRKFDVFAGFNLGESFDLGAHLFFAKGSADYYTESSINKDGALKGGQESLELNFSNSIIGLGLGATIGLFADGTLDIGVRYANYSYAMDRNTVPQPVVDGGNAFSLDTRMSARLSKHWWLVPAMQFNYTGFTGLVDTGIGSANGLDRNTSTVDWTAINFDLGLGMQMKVPGKGNLFTSVGIDYSKDQFSSLSDYGPSHDITYTVMQLPYWRTGFEAPMYDWLDLRAGFVKRWGSWQMVDDYLDGGAISNAAKEGGYYRRRESHLTDVKYSIDSDNPQGYRMLPDFETFVGATMKYNGWEFGVEVDPNFLFHGPFNSMVGGGDAADALAGGDKPWFARFELAYQF